MPTDDALLGGGESGGSNGDTSGDVGGDASGGGSTAGDSSYGDSGRDSSDRGDSTSDSSDDVAGGDGPARSMGKGDPITQAAQKAYRNLTAPERPEQNRNKRGEFSKGQRQPQPQPNANKDQQQQQQPRQPNQQQQPLDPDRVPDSWTNEAKALWQNLPPRARAEINKREQDYRNGHARLNQQLDGQKPYVQFMQHLDKAAEPYLAGWQQRGVNVADMMRDSVGLMGTLHFGDNTQKLEAIRQLVKVFGVQIPRRGDAATAQPADGQPPAAAQPQAQPQPTTVQDPRVDQLMQRFQREDQIRQQEQQRQQAAAQERITADVDAFVQNPANEHFQLVYEKMAQLLERGLAKDLADAYDQAVWSTPAARSAMQGKQRQSEIAAANKAAAEARRAAGMRTGGGKPANFQPAGTPASGNNRNDTIVSAVRQHMQKFGRAA